MWKKERDGKDEGKHSEKRKRDEEDEEKMM